MSNPSQLLLLSDHIKLSLLERQRAASLNLDPNPTTESHISRSLESLYDGLQRLKKSPDSDEDTVASIQKQYDDLYKKFHGTASKDAEETLNSPNNNDLAGDFERVTSNPQKAQNTSSLKRKEPQPQPSDPSKSVRFQDNPSTTSLDTQDEANRAALFPSKYTDEEPTPPDPMEELDNQQIHAYHQQVIAEQDEQLDVLSGSIGRQRQLAVQVGDELEGQVALLDEVDRGVDRHQGRLDGAKRRLKGVSKKATQNWGMTTIIVLIVILVLLIVILK